MSTGAEDTFNAKEFTEKKKAEAATVWGNVQHALRTDPKDNPDLAKFVFTMEDTRVGSLLSNGSHGTMVVLNPSPMFLKTHGLSAQSDMNADPSSVYIIGFTKPDKPWSENLLMKQFKENHGVTAFGMMRFGKTKEAGLDVMFKILKRRSVTRSIDYIGIVSEHLFDLINQYAFTGIDTWLDFTSSLVNLVLPAWFLNYDSVSAYQAELDQNTCQKLGPQEIADIINSVLCMHVNRNCNYTVKQFKPADFKRNGAATSAIIYPLVEKNDPRPAGPTLTPFLKSLNQRYASLTTSSGGVNPLLAAVYNL